MQRLDLHDWQTPIIIKDSNIEATEIALWRYMSLPKFIHLISTGGLYFSLPTQFEDPFETHLPRKVYNSIAKSITSCTNTSDTDKQYLIASYRNTYMSQLISCWHASEFESEAMWKLYSQDKQSIAIKTTSHKLIKSLYDIPTHARAGLVKYIDFDNPPTLNQIDQVFLKRNSYAHEREFRVTFTQQSLFPKDHGELYKCDISTLILEIIISPWTDSVFEHATRSAIEKFLENVSVSKSKLLDTPDYGNNI